VVADLAEGAAAEAADLAEGAAAEAAVAEAEVVVAEAAGGDKQFDEEKTNENKTKYYDFVETLHDRHGVC
jgi:hypothetical protein